MKKLLSRTIAFAAFSALTLACVPPKVMIDHSYVDAEKASKSYIQRSADNDKLFDMSVRVCDVQANNTDTNCKDTKVLGNVVPGSVY
jgi:molybdopterin/thiamine biosynthesis adenylyltransferase